MDPRVELFLGSPAFGVVGASASREKYGNKVLRTYLQNGRKVWGVNPKETLVEGAPCVPSVDDLPAEVQALSIITPPAATEQVVARALARGIRNIWMQPGAESPAAVEACRRAGANFIADGTCALVVLHFREHA